MALSARGGKTVDTFMPAITATVKQRIGQNSKPPIDLSTAENCLARDELLLSLKDSLEHNISDGDLSYSRGLTGCPQLLDSLSSFFSNFFTPRLPVENQHIVVGPGALSILNALLFTICNPGDGVLVMTPYWSGFDVVLSSHCGACVVPVTVTNHNDMFSSGVSRYLEETLQSATVPVKCLLLCNPHNPLGCCYTRAALGECLRFCQRHDLHLISDEVYALSVFNSPDVNDPAPFISILSFDPTIVGYDLSRVHMVWSASKDFGASGLRLGALVTQDNPRLTFSAALAASNQVSNLTSIVFRSVLSQEALVNRLLGMSHARLGKAYSKLVDFLKKRRISYHPSYAGLYLWVQLSAKIKTWEQESMLWEALLDSGVSLSAGKGYHAAEPGWFRITFAVPPEVLTEGIRRIEGLLDIQK